MTEVQNQQDRCPVCGGIAEGNTCCPPVCGHCGEVDGSAIVRADGSGDRECDRCYASNVHDALVRGQFTLDEADQQALAESERTATDRELDRAIERGELI